MASFEWMQKRTLLSSFLLFTLLNSHHCVVNGDYDTATPGSIFTTRTWAQNQMVKSPEEFMEKVVTKGCAKSYTTACMKLDIVGFVDRLAAVEKYQIVPGLELVRENGTRRLPADFAASLTKEHPHDVDARLDAFLVKRLAQYLNSHSVNFKLFDPEGFAKARKFTEQKLRTGRKGGGLGGLGGGKDKGGYGMLAAAGMMMGGTLGALAFGTIAALAGKALMTALMSLMLSAVVGLKGLSGGSKGVHYEIIQKPVYSHSHSHSSEVQHVDHHGGGGGGGGGHSSGGGGGGGGGGHHSGYGRSYVIQDQTVATHPLLEPGVLFDAETHAQTQQDGGDGHEMAYSAYEPQQ